MESKKRKRDPDYPRITYHAEERTFDRLFKEESLWEMKETVSQKLGFVSSANVQLVQLRAGMSVDLEDDDDFDAFYALSRTTPALDIQVTIITNDQIGGGQDSPDHAGSRQFTLSEGQRQSAFAESTPVQQSVRDFCLRDSSQASTATSTSNQKRKVSFLDCPQTATPPVNVGAKRRKKNSGAVAVSDLSSASRLSPTVSSVGPSDGKSGLNSLGSDLENPTEDNSMSVGEDLVHTNQPTSSEMVPIKKKKSSKGKQDVAGNGARSPPAADFLMIEDEPHPPVKTSAKKRPNPSGVAPLDEVTLSSPSSSTRVGPLVGGAATKKKRRSTTDSAFAEQLANSIVQAGEVNEGSAAPKNKRSKKGNKQVQGEQANNTSVVSSITLPSDEHVVRNKGRQSGPEHPDSSDNTTVTKSAGKKKVGEDARRDVSKDLDESDTSAVVLTKTKKSKNAKARTPTDEGAQSGASRAAAPHLDHVIRDEIEVEPANQPKRPKQSGKSKLRLSGDIQEIPNSVDKTLTPTSSKKSTRKRQSELVPCPLCLQKPLHLRYQCPVITAGPESIMKRLLELKEKHSSTQGQLIEELEHLIKQGKTKRAKKANVSAGPAAIPGLGMRQTLSNQSPSDEITDVPANLASSILPAANFDRHLPSWKPVVPRGSQISDFVVDISSKASRKKSDGSSESYEDEDSDSSKAPDGLDTTTSPDVSTYTGIDLDALVRGPPSRSSTIANIILATEIEERGDEEEVEEVILEEEDDDMKFRRFSKRSQRIESSSDEDDLPDGTDDGDEDIASPPPDHVAENTQAQPTRSENRSPAASYTSFQAIDNLGEFVEVDKRGDIAICDAQAVDTAASKLAEESEDDTQVAPSAGGGDETNVSIENPLSTGQRKEVTSELVQQDRGHKLQTDEPGRAIPTSANKPAPQQDVDLVENVTDTTLADNERLPSRQRSTSIVPPSQMGTIKQTLQYQSEEDPIEPADDLLDERRQPEIDEPNGGQRGRSPTPMPAPTKIGKLKRMKDKNGRVSTPEADLLVLKAGARKAAAETLVDLEVGEQRRTRPVTRSRSASVQPPVRAATPGKAGGRPLKTKVLEAAEKLAAKGEKARLKEEQARLKEEEKARLKEEKARLKEEKARLKEEKLAAKEKASTKRPSVVVDLTSTSVKEFPLATLQTPLQNDPGPLRPPSSQPQWAALSQSSPAPDADSSDQLQYSSPNRKDDAAPVEAALSKEKGKSRHDDSAHAASQEDPLFMLTESQVPFPFSQWGDDNATQPRSHERPGTVSGSESEDEPATDKKLKRPRMVSGSSYRKLTDIASQQGLFPVPPITPATFPTRSVTSSKFNVADADDEDDEEEDTDDSGSDSGTEKSHIPLSRRAGASLLPV